MVLFVFGKFCLIYVVWFVGCNYGNNVWDNGVCGIIGVKLRERFFFFIIGLML